ncbi:MAG: glycoside hydrolase family 2 [Planctomycetia bacterium]|nr:glycoside hydrolase family 2 [Planctomycetia bacterium]
MIATTRTTKTRFAALAPLLLLSPLAAIYSAKALAADAPAAAPPPAGAAADWKPAAGPLLTRWAKDVSVTNALPEYPRPQLVRKDWQNLNGLWDIKLGDGTAAKILVPYPIESALSGVMKHSDRMTYRRSFDIPKDWSGRHVLLHFGAVDWETKVSVNGKELGVHRGGYDAFSYDITSALKPEGPQEITVEVFDPTNAAGQPRGKQTLYPGGIMYTPTSGIWQTVWLEPVAEAHVASLKLVPDVDESCLRLTVDGAGVKEGETVEAVVSDAGKTVATASGPVGKEIKLAIADPKLWSPDAPHLYDLSVTLKSGDKTVDSVSSYFGMRKIALAKDEKGITRPMLNGKFIFQVGPLDQGFWPDGIYTAPTDEALRGDIESMKKLGFNCVRKHIKVEPSRWYYWCDKLGLMVWQDMPSANSYRGRQEQRHRIDVDRPEYKTELLSMVKNHANHPAIIMWVLFNEGQGQHDTDALAAAVKELDPTRLINGGSGSLELKCGDVIDMHAYPGPNSPKPEEHRAAVLGEFGGLGLKVDGHTWTKNTWGYKGAADAEALTSGYEQLLAKAWGMKDNPGLSAVIYTQLTDVETEANGLLTYDRAINKVDVARAAAANTGKPRPAASKDDGKEQKK